MVKVDLTPTYKGLWMSKEDFGLFYMWKKERGCGKIFEEDSGRLVEADFTDLRNNGINFSFIKKYKNPVGNLLEGDIFYEGFNQEGFIEGNWIVKDYDNRKKKGFFYLAGNPDSFDEVKKILGGLNFQNLDNAIKNKQREFPYTPII